MNCQFSFGPNRSYFCSAGPHFAWSDHNLPPTLIRVLADPQRPQKIETPNDVAFPMEPGEYVMCWRTPQGENRYAVDCMGPQHARLARFIKDTTTVPGGHTTRTVFGPTASFFSVSERGYCWQNLPQALEDDIHASLYVRQPTTVALGAHGAYVVLYSDGAAALDLRGLYPLLEGMMRNTQEVALRRGIAYVALNPHIPGEYYAVYGDGSASWNFPTAWTAAVAAVSREIKPVWSAPAPLPMQQTSGSLEMAAPSMQATSGSTGPVVAPSPSAAPFPPPPPPLPMVASTPIAPVASAVSAALPHTASATSGFSAERTVGATSSPSREVKPAGSVYTPALPRRVPPRYVRQPHVSPPPVIMSSGEAGTIPAPSSSPAPLPPPTGAPTPTPTPAIASPADVVADSHVRAPAPASAPWPAQTSVTTVSPVHGLSGAAGTAPASPAPAPPPPIAAPTPIPIPSAPTPIPSPVPSTSFLSPSAVGHTWQEVAHAPGTPAALIPPAPAPSPVSTSFLSPSAVGHTWQEVAHAPGTPAVCAHCHCHGLPGPQTPAHAHALPQPPTGTGTPVQAAPPSRSEPESGLKTIWKDGVKLGKDSLKLGKDGLKLGIKVVAVANGIPVNFGKK